MSIPLQCNAKFFEFRCMLTIGHEGRHNNFSSPVSQWTNSDSTDFAPLVNSIEDDLNFLLEVINTHLRPTPELNVYQGLYDGLLGSHYWERVEWIKDGWTTPSEVTTAYESGWELARRIRDGLEFVGYVDIATP